MLAFAFGSRLRPKTQRSKTRVLVRRLPNGKPQERLRFRDLRGETLAFKKRIAISSCVLEADGSGQEVCFGPYTAYRPDPGKNARDQDGSRTGGWMAPEVTWMDPKPCKTNRTANLDGTFGPGMGPGRPQDRTQARVWMAPPETVTDV